MENKKKIKILVVDDEEVVRDFLKRFLSLESMEVALAEDGFQAIEAVKKEKYALVFMDVRMPKLNGIQAFSELKKIDPDLKCIFMTGYALEEGLLEVVKNAGISLLKKPFNDIQEIRAIVNSFLFEEKMLTETGLKEKRAYARLGVELSVVCKIKNRDACLPEDSIPAFCKNISLGGAGLLAKNKLSCGTKIELSFNTFLENKVFKAQGEVTQVRESREKPGYYDIGVKFIEIDLAGLSFIIFNRNKTLG